MELTDAERRLLALHYVFPVPLNQLEQTLRDRPQSRKVIFISSE